MAKIRFIKPGEPSQKKDYRPSGIFRKRWKIAFFISGVLNVLSIGCLIYKYFNN